MVGEVKNRQKSMNFVMLFVNCWCTVEWRCIRPDMWVAIGQVDVYSVLWYVFGLWVLKKLSFYVPPRSSQMTMMCCRFWSCSLAYIMWYRKCLCVVAVGSAQCLWSLWSVLLFSCLVSLIISTECFVLFVFCCGAPSLLFVSAECRHCPAKTESSVLSCC